MITLRELLYSACIVRGEGGKRQYLKGSIMISKSPTIHPGDVQIVEAIGEPPAGSPLRELVNCVVFSQKGRYFSILFISILR